MLRKIKYFFVRLYFRVIKPKVLFIIKFSPQYEAGDIIMTIGGEKFLCLGSDTFRPINKRFEKKYENKTNINSSI